MTHTIKVFFFYQYTQVWVRVHESWEENLERSEWNHYWCRLIIPECWNGLLERWNKYWPHPLRVNPLIKDDNELWNISYKSHTLWNSSPCLWYSSDSYLPMAIMHGNWEGNLSLISSKFFWGLHSNTSSLIKQIRSKIWKAVSGFGSSVNTYSVSLRESFTHDCRIGARSYIPLNKTAPARGAGEGGSPYLLQSV